MSRALTTGRPVERTDQPAGHPSWCAQGHHCTALTMPAGEHASIPEIWLADLGRFIGTRYRDQRGADRVEVRAIVALADNELIAQAQARHLLALTCTVVQRAFSTNPNSNVKNRKDTFGD
jgi:hypothetical protein